MDYVLTQHAKEMIQKRQIRLVWVEHVLSMPELIEPDAIDPDLEHRLSRIPEFGGRVLRVIVNRSKKPPHVITGFLDQREVIL